jgi:hypothetical protein
LFVFFSFFFSLWNFLSSIIRWTASDYPYGIYKLFCSMSLKLHSNVTFCCWCQFFRLSDCCLTANEHFSAMTWQEQVNYD